MPIRVNFCRKTEVRSQNQELNPGTPTLDVGILTARLNAYSSFMASSLTVKLLLNFQLSFSI